MCANFIVENNIALKPFNTFAVDASAEYFTSINTLEALETLLKHKRWRQRSKIILGQGSNTLFCNHVKGLVIKVNLPGISLVKETKEHVWLRVGAGVIWHQLVLYCLEHDYAGIENLALIPGTVGAAPIQNIGAYGVEIKDCIESVDTYCMTTGEKIVFTQRDCEFAYRDSFFKRSQCHDFIITSVRLKLNKTPVFHTDYGAIQETLATMQVDELSISTVAKAVMQIRMSKLPDPQIIPNAGSFFKNPCVTAADFQKLKTRYAHVPAFDAPNEQVKIPAAWLIDQCGWKGKRVGNVGVHEKQALVLVNYGNATGENIWQLAQKIQADVKNRFAIDLVPEVTIVNL